MYIINSRADLESIRGTKQFENMIYSLVGSMKHSIDVAEYPENYRSPDYDGPEIEPIIEEQENLTTIQRFGFTKEQILKELEKL
jgi:hypothetical protein